MLVGDLDLQGTRGVVVCCHGMLANRGGSKLVRLCELLATRGISTFRFDRSGRGEGAGSLLDLSIAREQAEVSAAVDEVAAQDLGSIAVFGSSLGGTAALLAAARDERIIAVATLAALAHPRDLAERMKSEVERWRQGLTVDTELGPIGPSFLEDALQRDVLGAVAVLWAPVLAVHGGRDEVVPTYDSHDIASAARNAELEIFDDADHRFTDPTLREAALVRIADFFAKLICTQ